MHLTLLLERRWSPYSKWLGTAYDARGRRLDTESSLCQALDELAGRDVTVQFWDRPYQTIEPDFLSSLPAGLPLPTGIGSVEQWCDSIAVLTPQRRVELRSAYESWSAGTDDP